MVRRRPDEELTSLFGKLSRVEQDELADCLGRVTALLKKVTDSPADDDQQGTTRRR